uniref:Uncharacterized protein n=1 Tax=uncultured Armatimonadetes bacterium TaxID=157466 RepID=A0A6J4IKL3_9BACT|nr:hypothetical protein AVDCRST_MAG63-1995 [uncultured Armatimonadetes bacterium]
MNKQKTALLVAAATFGGMVVGQALPARAQLGDILTGGAVLLLVNRFSGQIDRFVNQVTGNRTNNVRESTRVVPVLTVGKGTYVGAVQVTGPRNLVDRVQAVAQVEATTRIGRELRVRGLIPIATRRATDLGTLSRVKGVGVSAIIDLRL